MTLLTVENYIDGAYAPAASGGWLTCEDPYAAAPWGRMPRSGPEDVDRAVAAARRAFTAGPWARMTAPQRGAQLHRIAEAIAAHAEELARIESRDNGKTYREMLGQLKRVPEWYRFYGGLCDKINGAVLPTEKPEMMNYTRYEPLGVIGMITPWNSPLMLLSWKLAPALAAGNVAVVKPSEYTSASALRFAEILTEEAGLPAGVLNVVTGLGAEAGAALTAHPDVAKVAFTGGIGGGRAAYMAAAANLRPASLELGGKSPNIIFADADLEQAARGVVSGIFGSGGQSCVAGSRALVHRSVHDALVARMAELTGKIRLGDPMEDSTDIGPVANRAQYDRIMTCIGWAKEDGATCVTGGAALADPKGGAALFVAPTIFTGVAPKDRIAQEEVFGPVLAVLPFDTEEEAIAIANDSAFGLGAGIWTRDVARVHRVAARIEAGTIWVNSYKGGSHISPFGGYKQSGIGREGGIEMIHDYLQVKSIWLNLAEEAPYPFPL
ncbi:aldehyde dehydrogenase family protein [Pseudooceanicola sp. GBMRC 2024]|uniref:Aldehyde dehydrogenase family protein n=2 Tax=Paracoccaceae TaxID=31989 RepID=A0A6L7G4Y4_9RHOB|nr:aldehyde dehydrogenase family protein [Pseudooceanicola albus]